MIGVTVAVVVVARKTISNHGQTNKAMTGVLCSCSPLQLCLFNSIYSKLHSGNHLDQCIVKWTQIMSTGFMNTEQPQQKLQLQQ